MEFIAILLLAPLIWSTSNNSGLPAVSEIAPQTMVVASVPANAFGDAEPTVESQDGHWIIRPPRNQNLTMTVLDHRGAARARGPASVGAPSRRIDVIVSAP